MKFKWLRVLTWKNVKLRFRNWPSLILEIAVPLTTSFFVSLLRATLEMVPVPGTSTNATSVWNSASINHQWFLYVPKVPVTDALVNARNKSRWRNVKGFNTLEEGIRFHELNTTCTYEACGKILAPVVIFEGVDKWTKTLPKNLSYKISISVESNTVNAKNPLESGKNWRYLSDVLWIKHAIGEMIMAYWKPKAPVILDLKKNTFPTPPTVSDNFTQKGLYLRSVIQWSFVMTVLIITKAIVMEKQFKLKDTFKLMGMPLYTYWFSWFSLGFMFGQVSILIQLFILNWSMKYVPVYASTNVEIQLLILEVFLIECVSFACLISCFIKRAKAALIAAFCMYMIVVEGARQFTILYSSERFLLYFVGTPVYMIGLTKTMMIVAMAEEKSFNLDFTTIADSSITPFSVLEGIFLMLLNTIFNIVIVWYLENILPGVYDVPRPYLFFLTLEYWNLRATNEIQVPKDLHKDETYFGPEPNNVSPDIQLKNVWKVYDKAAAVIDVSLNIYQGQITALMGENRAGKTTIMSLIAGFLPPTSGSVLVDGHDVQENTRQARKHLGLCPMHNILFNKLTCKEHLEFYFMIKKKVNLMEIFDLLSAVGLFEKRNDFAMTLSGAQKRKLSVACALAGDNKIVLLDEPTSGIDPRAKRELWTFLKRAKKGRTILLTTHNVEEAVTLGDRVAIIHKGQIKSCGTPTFLKQVYGSGCQLSLLIGKGCVIQRLSKAIQSVVGSAVFQGIVREEARYLLPGSMSKEFPELFRLLEQRKKEFGIRSYGFATTRIDEAFVKEEAEYERASFPGNNSDVSNTNLSGTSTDNSPVQGIASFIRSLSPINQPINDSDSVTPTTELVQTAGSSQAQQDTLTGHEIHSRFQKYAEHIAIAESQCLEDTLKDESRFQKNTGCCLFCQQLKATFIKKFLLLKHSWLSVVLQLMLPVFLIGLNMVFVKMLGDDEKQVLTPFNFSAKYLEGKTVLLGIDPDVPSVANLSKIYKQQFLKSNIDYYEVTSRVFLDYYLQLKISKLGPTVFTHTYIMGAYIHHNFGNTTAYYQRSAGYSAGLSVHFLVNAMLKQHIGSEYGARCGLSPVLKVAKVNKLKARDEYHVIASLLFGMLILPACFIYPVIGEREVGSKHLQFVYGMNPFAYWLITFLWDTFLYALVVAVCVVMFHFFQPYILLENGRWRIMLTIFSVYGMAMLAQVYFLTAHFRRPESGVAFVLMINFAASIILITLLGAVDSMGEKNYLSEVVRSLGSVLMIFIPNYNMAFSLVQLSIFAAREGENENFFDFFLRTKPDYLDIKIFFMYTIGQIFGFWVLVFMSEFKVARKIWYYFGSREEMERIDLEKLGIIIEEEDSDVTDERRRIAMTPLEKLLAEESLLLKNVCKMYTPATAVRDISLQVSRRECLGLIGQSGAGRSAIFKMITGDMALTSGNIFLMGHNVRDQLNKVVSYIGYCPHEDPLLDGLTGLQTLYFYGRVIGIPENMLRECAMSLIDELHLKEYANLKTKFYSAGNKRRLSTAISLIGDAPFILLDEPTRGLDLSAKRTVWRVLRTAKATGKTLILSSNSMEECDALCTRIAIMVAGKLKCLGSPQHLKMKFNQGFTIIVKMKWNETPCDADEAVEQYIMDIFPGAKIFEKQPGYIHFQVPEAGLQPSFISSAMEEAKELFNLEDFAIHQTTLEQIFLSVAKDAYPLETSDRDIFVKLLSCFD